MTTPPSIEERIVRLEGSFEQIERRLGTLEQDLPSPRTELNARFDRLEASLDRERPTVRLETAIDRVICMQPVLLGAIAASILATVLTRVL